MANAVENVVLNGHSLEPESNEVPNEAEELVVSTENAAENKPKKKKKNKKKTPKTESNEQEVDNIVETTNEDKEGDDEGKNLLFLQLKSTVTKHKISIVEGGAATGKKKKRSRGKKKPATESSEVKIPNINGQTDPPTVPIVQLYPDGNNMDTILFPR